MGQGHVGRALAAPHKGLHFVLRANGVYYRVFRAASQNGEGGPEWGKTEVDTEVAFF